MQIRFESETESKSPTQSLFLKEYGAALHSLSSVAVEGFGIQAIHNDTFDWRRTNKVALSQLLDPAFRLPPEKETGEILAIRRCLSELIDLRSEAYHLFSEAGVFDDEYFGIRDEMVRAAADDLNIEYDDPNATLEKVYKSSDFKRFANSWETMRQDQGDGFTAIGEPPAANQSYKRNSPPQV